MNSIIPIFIPHLGCPYDCVFCNQRKISGSLVPATADDVRRIISAALRVVPAGAEVAFYGGSFTAIPRNEQEALLLAAEEFISEGRISGIRLSTRPDCINDEIASFLKLHHVKTVELGVQSLDEKVLLLSGRGHSKNDAVNASRCIKRNGINLILQMMTGLPGAGRESDIITAQQIAELHPDGVRIYPTVIVKDTALCSMWESGSYREHTVEDAVSLCAEIHAMFREKGIPVIRMGLNPTDDLSGGNAVAGAYHPALGEMIMAREMRNIAAVKMEKLGVSQGSSIKLVVSPRFVSKMVGQHRCNLAWLKERFSLMNIRVSQREMPDYSVLIENN